jgi:hypothetical protein
MSKENWALARNIVLFSELEKILTSFDKAIIIGGVGLAKTAYSNIGLRPMSDIDLLVKEKDLPSLKSVLENLGYRFENERSDEIHYTNNNPDITFHIDIHTDLIYIPKPKLSDIWARAVKANFGSIRGFILSPEDALIYAITDAFIGHGRITQNTINDVTVILDKYLINWILLRKLIKQYGLEVPLYYGIISIKKQSDIDVPGWFMNKIKPTSRKFLERKIYKIALKRPAEDLAPVLRFATCPKKGSLVARSFFPSGGFMSRRYNRVNGLSWIYYPYRVINHFWRLIKLAKSAVL